MCLKMCRNAICCWLYNLNNPEITRWWSDIWRLFSLENLTVWRLFDLSAFQPGRLHSLKAFQPEGFTAWETSQSESFTAWRLFSLGDFTVWRLFSLKAFQPTCQAQHDSLGRYKLLTMNPRSQGLVKEDELNNTCCVQLLELVESKWWLLSQTIARLTAKNMF